VKSSHAILLKILSLISVCDDTKFCYNQSSGTHYRSLDGVFWFLATVAFGLLSWGYWGYSNELTNQLYPWSALPNVDDFPQRNKHCYYVL